MADSTIKDDSKEDDPTLLKKLREVGLDEIKWSELLASELGVKEVKSLAEVSGIDFKILKEKASNDQEKSSLKKLQKFLTKYNITTTDKEQVLASVQPTPTISKVGRTPTKSECNSVACTAPCQAEMIADGKCVSQASGGMLLHGFYKKQTDMFDVPKSTQKVLAPLRAVAMLKPSIKSYEIVKEFHSITELETFKNSMTYSGKKLSIGPQADINIKSLKLAAACTLSRRPQTVQQETSSEKKTDVSFIRATIIYLPIASFDMPVDDVQLSESAIRMLKSIERSSSSDRDLLCKQFFDSFGSHIHSGLIHLGGIFIDACQYGEIGDGLTDDQKSMNVSSWSGKLCGPQIEVLSMSKENLTAKHTTNLKENDKKRFVRSFLVNGGKLLNNSEDWKRDIEDDKSSWALIKFDDQLQGVWEIVERHTTHFLGAHSLAEYLHSRWHSSTSLVDNVYNCTEAENVIRETVEQLGTWVINWQTDSCESYLSYIFDRKRKLVTDRHIAQLSATPEFNEFMEQLHHRRYDIPLQALKPVIGLLMNVFDDKLMTNVHQVPLQKWISSEIDRIFKYQYSSITDALSLSLVMEKCIKNIDVEQRPQNNDEARFQTNLMFSHFFRIVDQDIYEKVLMSNVSYHYDYRCNVGVGECFKLNDMRVVLDAIRSFLVVPKTDSCREAHLIALAIKYTKPLSNDDDRYQQIEALTKDMIRDSDNYGRHDFCQLFSKPIHWKILEEFLENVKYGRSELTSYTNNNLLPANPLLHMSATEHKSQGSVSSRQLPLNDNVFSILRSVEAVCDKYVPVFDTQDILKISDYSKMLPSSTLQQAVVDTVLLKYSRLRTYCTKPDSRTANVITGKGKGKLVLAKTSIPQCIHDMDMTVIIWNCCDNVVKQLIAEKTFLKRYSLPFILPPLTEIEQPHGLTLEFTKHRP